MSISAVCVYCGSSSGIDPRFGTAADDLGRSLAAAGIRLVYGGGAVGLMGRVADAVMASGGEVTGVIPAGLFTKEVGHPGLTELIEVGSMHERKQIMFERSDAFVALPGGFGTLEELAEVTTWGQLGLHTKPIVLADVAGFWLPFVRFLDDMVAAGLLRAENRALIGPPVAVEGVLAAIASYRVEPADKWIGPGEI